MNYSELIQAYFERSVALQWYWTIYVLVIGGVLGGSGVATKEKGAAGERRGVSPPAQPKPAGLRRAARQWFRPSRRMPAWQICKNFPAPGPRPCRASTR